MSRQGINLFARDNPPRGYNTTTELWRIRGIGLTPDPDHITLKCNTSFKLFYPKKSPRGKSWKPLSHLKKFPIKLNVGLTTFNKFHHIIADACNAKRSSQTSLACLACPSDSRRVHEKNDYQIKDKASYRHWMDTIVELGKDRTEASLELTMDNPGANKKLAQAEIDVQDHVLTTEAAKDAAAKRKATGDDSSVEVVTASDFSPLNVHMRKLFELHEPNKNYHPTIPVFRDSTDPDQYLLLTTAVCQEWAHALRGKVDGVGWFNPPAKFKMLKLSSKKRKTGDSSNTVGPPIVPDFNLVRKYVKFVNLDPAKRENVLKTLANNETDHTRLFESKSITDECMRRWGLADGTIAHLKDNVNRYFDHLGSK
ncbi:hypothetical protein MJO28_000030 [Puccinia striiformis f. sp. tritici]|uniref:Uncharacterized protein n=1 Tax=Puccinia striiformis f. sp. tritici TaxID=168172 RepID=A0ACC0EXD2_9BASI|nr:hypothetical protein MJO28_000030 [Puccinia striiformis f. sp. tritici]